MRSGRYVAEMRVDTADATLAETLAQSGFARSGDSLLLKVEGAL
jgi:general secretion pathway protein N